MDLKDVVIDGWRKIADANSAGEGIDEDWEAVLPETYDITANEIFLTLHRHFVDDSMNRRAAEMALTHPARIIDEIDDGKLVLHCLVRWSSLGIADNPNFQTFVDSIANGDILPIQGDNINQQRIGWAKPSRIWLPLSEEDFVRIFGALVERFKQYLFAEHCWHTLTRRHVGKELNMDVFALLLDSEHVPEKYQNEALQRLSKLSSKVTKGLDCIDPRDPMQSWLAKLLELPQHTQFKKIGVTLTAIRQGAIDMQRAGGKHEHVSFEEKEQLADTVPDESLELPIEDMIDNEFLERFSANQPKIEEILSRESPKKRRAKIGKRRFKVMGILAHEPNLTSVEIAEWLKASEQTIGRDREKIKESWSLILEAIYS